MSKKERDNIISLQEVKRKRQEIESKKWISMMPLENKLLVIRLLFLQLFVCIISSGCLLVVIMLGGNVVSVSFMHLFSIAVIFFFNVYIIALIPIQVIRVEDQDGEDDDDVC